MGGKWVVYGWWMNGDGWWMGGGGDGRLVDSVGGGDGRCDVGGWVVMAVVVVSGEW